MNRAFYNIYIIVSFFFKKKKIIGKLLWCKRNKTHHVILLEKNNQLCSADIISALCWATFGHNLSSNFFLILASLQVFYSLHNEVNFHKYCTFSSFCTVFKYQSFCLLFPKCKRPCAVFVPGENQLPQTTPTLKFKVLASFF